MMLLVPRSLHDFPDLLLIKPIGREPENCLLVSEEGKASSCLADGDGAIHGVITTGSVVCHLHRSLLRSTGVTEKRHMELYLTFGDLVNCKFVCRHLLISAWIALGR